MDMTVETVRDVLLWITIIHFGILLLWLVAFSLAHDWILKVHGRWFRMPVEQFDAMHYTGMAVYKIGILFFGFVPYAALSIVG